MLNQFSKALFPICLAAFASGCATVSCPEGKALGAMPPNGRQMWCEKSNPDGVPVKHGPRKTWYRNGQLKAFEEFEDNFRHGTFDSWYPNGQRERSGDYLKGREDGRLRMWHPNGNLKSEGDFSKGQEEGEWTHYWDNGNVRSEGNFKEGRRHGEFKFWDLEYFALRHITP